VVRLAFEHVVQVGQRAGAIAGLQAQFGAQAEGVELVGEAFGQFVERLQRRLAVVLAAAV
jgi:hypothetical protein